MNPEELSEVENSEISICNWNTELIKLNINIIKSIIPTPTTMEYLNPILAYIKSTHPTDLINLQNIDVDGPDPRRYVLKLLYEILENSSDDLLDEFHNVYKINLFIGMLEHPSSKTRLVILKIISLYYRKRDYIVEIFKKFDGVGLISQILKKFNPKLIEFQVLIDLVYPTNTFQVVYITNEIKKKLFFEKEKGYVIKIDEKLAVSESLKNPQFLIPIFTNIPKLQTDRDKIHILECLLNIFKLGGNFILKIGTKTKTSFIENKIHIYLSKYFNIEFVNQNIKLMETIQKFLVEYIVFCLLNKSNEELQEVLFSYLLNTGFKIDVNQNLQRLLLNDILMYFTKNYNQKEKNKNMLGQAFATYVTISVDNILQWFPLPNESPFLMIKNLYLSKNKSVFSFSKFPKKEKIIEDDDLIDDDEIDDEIDISEIKEKSIEVDELIENDETEEKIEKEIKEIFISPNKIKEKKNKLKIVNWYNMMKEELSNKQSQKEKVDFSIYSYGELNGYKYWLFETIRLFLIKFNRNDIYEISLIDQLKRLILNFLDGPHKTINDEYFILLQLLYGYQEEKQDCELILKYIHDSMFITIFLSETEKLFGIKNELKLTLVKKIWYFIFENGKSYLNEIFIKEIYYILENSKIKKLYYIIEDFVSKKVQNNENVIKLSN
jgi:hypothetical protein